MRRVDVKSAMLGFGTGMAATALACVLYVTFANALVIIGEARIMEAAELIEGRDAQPGDSTQPATGGNIIWLDSTPQPTTPQRDAERTLPPSVPPQASTEPPTAQAPSLSLPAKPPPPTQTAPTQQVVPPTEPPATQPLPPAEPPPAEPPPTEPPPTEPPPTEPPPQRGTAVVQIRRGDSASAVAGRLLDAGVIDGTGPFLDRLAERRLTGELNVGEYVLAIGMDIDALIDEIVVRRR